MNNIDSKLLIQSTKWSAIAEVAVRLASPLANIVLVRLLTPEIFGLVSTYTLLITFADIFVDGGFQKHLIQHEFSDKIERDECTNVAFWTNLILSFVIWIVIILFRNPIAALVGSPGHGNEIAVICIIIPLTSFSSIQLALYKRDFKFKQLMPIRLATSMVPIIITIPIALYLKNGWAIIIGNVTKEILNAVLLTIRSDWKPRAYYSFKRLKEMISNCLWLLADALMVWITSYSGTLIVSHSLDATHLGLYKTGSSTIIAYLNIIFLITQPIIYSALSRVQNSKTVADSIYAQYLKYVSYIIIPLGIGVFVFRFLVTSLLLGKSWLEATTIIGVTGLTYPAFMLIGQFNSNYFRAMGKPKVAMLVQTLYSIILIMCLLISVKTSFFTFSIISSSICLTYALISALAIILVFHYPMRLMIKGWIPPCISSLIMATIGLIAHRIWSYNIWIEIFLVLISIVTYFICLLIFPTSRQDIYNTINTIRKHKNSL